MEAAQREYMNVNDFLDDLPSMPCPKPPSGGRYCNVCVRINRDVAQDCSFSGLSQDFVIEEKPKFKVVAGASTEKKMSFKVISEEGTEGDEAGHGPILGIEKEFPLIEIVKPQNPSVKPLEMELLEEEPVVFEMASDDDLKKQELDEVLKNIIIEAQPLLERAKVLGLDISNHSAKLREGVGLYSKGDYEKAHALLKDIVTNIVMESVLFTQNKLEDILKKKPDENTLPRYFAEAGARFKKKEYLKTFDYLKYVIDQSAKIGKDLEAAKAKAVKAQAEELTWEGDGIIGVTVLTDDEDEADAEATVVAAVSVDDESENKEVRVLKPLSKKPAKKVAKTQKAKTPKPASSTPKVQVVSPPKETQSVAKAADKTIPRPAPKVEVVAAPIAKPAQGQPAPSMKVKKKKTPVMPSSSIGSAAKGAPVPTPSPKPAQTPKPTAQTGQAPQPVQKKPDLKLTALLKAQEAVEIVSKKKASGMEVKKAEDLLAEARGYMSSGDYSKMIDLSQKAIDSLK